MERGNLENLRNERDKLKNELAILNRDMNEKGLDNDGPEQE